MKSPFLHGDRNEKSPDQEEYDLVPVFCCNPSKGKRIIGRSDVAGMGIASVSHQHAIQTVLAAIDFASQDIPSMSERRMSKKRIGPSTRPVFCLERFKFNINPGFFSI
jgi:hypothetical protein